MEKSIKKYTLKIKPMEDEINSIKNQVSVMQQKYREKVSSHLAGFFANKRLYGSNFLKKYCSYAYHIR